MTNAASNPPPGHGGGSVGSELDLILFLWSPGVIFCAARHQDRQTEMLRLWIAIVCTEYIYFIK